MLGDRPHRGKVGVGGVKRASLVNTAFEACAAPGNGPCLPVDATGAVDALSDHACGRRGQLGCNALHRACSWAGANTAGTSPGISEQVLRVLCLAPCTLTRTGKHLVAPYPGSVKQLSGILAELSTCSGGRPQLSVAANTRPVGAQRDGRFRNGQRPLQNRWFSSQERHSSGGFGSKPGWGRMVSPRSVRVGCQKPPYYGGNCRGVPGVMSHEHDPPYEGFFSPP